MNLGRVNIMELQPILNVDSNHIEKKVDDLIKKNKNIQLVEGELVANYYLDGIAGFVFAQFVCSHKKRK